MGSQPATCPHAVATQDASSERAMMFFIDDPLAQHSGFRGMRELAWRDARWILAGYAALQSIVTLPRHPSPCRVGGSPPSAERDTRSESFVRPAIGWHDSFNSSRTMWTRGSPCVKFTANSPYLTGKTSWARPHEQDSGCSTSRPRLSDPTETPPAASESTNGAPQP